MQRATIVAIIVLTAAATLAGCASAPKLTPWRADALLINLPPSCSVGTNAPQPEDAPATLVPGGLAVVRSAGAEIVLVAARACVMTVDVATSATEPLPTQVAPTSASTLKVRKT